MRTKQHFESYMQTVGEMSQRNDFLSHDTQIINFTTKKSKIFTQMFFKSLIRLDSKLMNMLVSSNSCAMFLQLAESTVGRVLFKN